jgi:hypothetical protein
VKENRLSIGVDRIDEFLHVYYSTFAYFANEYRLYELPDVLVLAFL